MKASDLLVKALENEDVAYIFGIPGEENLDFLDSLQHSSIRLIVTRHEQGAAFMAATYGRLTGKPGVCLSTLGPGATNLVTGAAYAQLGGMPLVMLTGQKPIKKSKQGRFQIIDVVDMMQPITKFSKQIVHGNTIPSLVREAFRRATEERPGAICLELPEDVAAETGCEDKVFQSSLVRRPHADETCLEAAVEKINAARQPLLLIGASANRNRITQALTELIDRCGIPFFNTQMGKGVVDERHELHIGTAALSDRDYLHKAIEHADLIINVGHDVIEKPPFFMKFGGTEVIHVNYFTAEVDEVYFPQLEVVGDIANSVQYLTAHLPRKAWDLTRFKEIKHDVEGHLSKYFEDERFPMLPQRLVNEIRKLMPSDGILTLDNGIYKIWFARNYKAHEPNTVLLDNALATMGAGLPSGMAAKITYPGRKVIAICGDGGFMMNSQELETAVRLKLDLVVVILNDSAYGMIKWKQEGMGFADYGLDFGNPDFVKYAEAYGATGHRITSSQDFTDTLGRCLDSPGVHLLDVPVDYSLNHQILTKGLSEPHTHE